jgi:hypothetical protein
MRDCGCLTQYLAGVTNCGDWRITLYGNVRFLAKTLGFGRLARMGDVGESKFAA